MIKPDAYTFVNFIFTKLVGILFAKIFVELDTIYGYIESRENASQLPEIL